MKQSLSLGEMRQNLFSMKIDGRDLVGQLRGLVLNWHLWWWPVVGGTVAFLGLYTAAQYSYLLFHSLAEIFAIVIGIAIFLLAWNSRRFLENNYFLVIGISFFFIGSLDITHTLAYKGIGIFTGADANLPTQLWLAARYLQASSFLLAPLFLGRKLKIQLVFYVYAIVTVLLFYSIFFWQVFPTVYIEGSGLTNFKKWSEIIISVMLLGGVGLLVLLRRYFDRGILHLLIAALGVTIVSELFFTSYFGVYDFANMLGHLLRIVAYYLLYKAIIETGLTRPYLLLFLEAKRREKELLTSQRNYQKLFHNKLSGVTYGKVVLNKRGKPVDFIFLEANDAFEKYTGLRKETIIGRRVTEVIPGIEKNAFDLITTFGQVAKTGVEAQFEKYLEQLGHWYSVYVYCPKKGYFISIITDVSDRRELDRRKDEFLSIASHELKTPVTTIRAFAQVLEKNLRKKGDIKNAHHVNHISDQADRLVGLVTSLLDISKIEAGKLIFQKNQLNLNYLVDKVIDELRHTVTSHKLIKEGEIALPVWGDVGRLEQVLINLITNAVKYSPGKDRVIVSVQEYKYQALVGVRDYGEGIKKEEQSKIFKRFYRTKKTEESNQVGFGLGLYICSEIIKQHQGKIWVESQPGQGSTFYFTLPLSKTVLAEVVQ